jgi:hypothetical protein
MLPGALIQHSVPTKRGKPGLESAIATLLGELEQFRKELVIREEKWVEAQSKIDVLRPIANEKFRSKLAEYNAIPSARRCAEGLRSPDRYDVPEELEIELLWDSLQPISRLPGIDPQARMMFLWLSPDPLAKIVLDELDNLLGKPSVENVNSMIALLATFPRAVPQRRASDENTPARRARRSVAAVYAEGLGEGIKLKHKDLCERLDARRVDLPSNAKWKRLNSWAAAWNDQEFRSSVSRWLSEATRGERSKT